METAAIFNRYFELSDQAITDPGAFEELISLFDENATFHPTIFVGPNIKSPLHGKQAITDFFYHLFARNSLMHHVWENQSTNETLQVIWAVVGKRQDGTVFTLQGIDIAYINSDGKFETLIILPWKI